MRIKTLHDAVQRYGEVKGGVWSEEAKHCTFVAVPEVISAHFINSLTGKNCTRIYCNKDIAPALELVFRDIVAEDLGECLKTFDGCLDIRTVRGREVLSTHAYALSIDLNAKENPLGSNKPGLDLRVVNIFKRYGWYWGNNFFRPDPMHLTCNSWECR